MSVQSEINRINGAKNDIKEAIEAKGVEVPSNTKITGMAALISQIAAGGSIRMWTQYDSMAGGVNSDGCYMQVLYDENNQPIGPNNAASHGTYIIMGFCASNSLGSDYKPAIGLVRTGAYTKIYISQIGGDESDEDAVIGLCNIDGNLCFRFSNYSMATASHCNLLIFKLRDE